jgi:uncharacterized protein YndB with AHSA1/START domain
MDIKFQIQTKILKPVEEVFDAVVNPAKLNGYFTKSATPMKEGERAVWQFYEAPGDYPVHIRQIIPNQLIIFEWDSHESRTRVEMRFEAIDKNSTMLKISESGWPETEKGLKGSYDNCQGWTHMSCCLRAFVEYGINLGEGRTL